MRQRTLDSTGDWIFGQGKQAYSADADGVRQNLLTRIRSFKSDCFFATEEGVDWLNLLGIGTKALLDQDIKRVILQTQDVTGILSYRGELDPEGRGYTVKTSVVTLYGNLDVLTGVQNA